MARSFSGDKKQLLSILKASLSHRGTALIDVISPCVTFNDHEGSTKSYAYVKDHDEPVGEVSFVPFFEDISIEYDAGTTTGSPDARRVEAVPEEGGGGLRPHRQAQRGADDPRNVQRGEFATGVLYVEPDKADFLTLLNVVDEPLATLPLERVRPGRDVLEEIMDSLRSVDQLP